jgi:hypothetical protein
LGKLRGYDFNVMNIDKMLLDNLTDQAKASPLLRMNMDYVFLVRASGTDLRLWSQVQ